MSWYRLAGVVIFLLIAVMLFVMGANMHSMGQLTAFVGAFVFLAVAVGILVARLETTPKQY